VTSRQILTNATSGESDEFFMPDRSLILKLIIVGTSSTPINAFVSCPSRTKNLIITLKGIDNGGAYVKLQAKQVHDNASFSDTADYWYQDKTDICYFA
jgi:hypothetical protein